MDHTKFNYARLGTKGTVGERHDPRVQFSLSLSLSRGFIDSILINASCAISGVDYLERIYKEP